MTPQFAIVVQARTSSNRLPGKVLKHIRGKPMLQWQLERIASALPQHRLIVATSANREDDTIASLCESLEVPCFRGALENVSKRLFDLSTEFGLDFIVRVGGDDPLIDPNCISSLVEARLSSGAEVVIGSHLRGWPYGASADLISRNALRYLLDSESALNDLEHTFPKFIRGVDSILTLWLEAPQEICRPDLRFSVDYDADFAIVSAVIDHFAEYFERTPSMAEIAAFLDNNADVRKLNETLQQGFTY